jgi:uncharacterized protein (DUF2236 family)
MKAVHRVAAPLGVLLRPAMRRGIQSLLSQGTGGSIDFDAPPGDPGLFGPDSVTWRIHSDFPAMMAGGVCALMLQTLHPLALAGVWDHSNFREDLLGRLRRTTAFVAGTTYAPRATAEALIARVSAIHQRVRGRLPDGRAYSAQDPELLTWVHVTEVSSFLAGYQRYKRANLPRGVCDRYYDEVARVAEALGAADVPRSQAQVQRYLRRVRAELEYSGRSAEVLNVLWHLRLPSAPASLFRDLFLASGAALLPDWAASMLRQRWVAQRRNAAAATALELIAPAIRAALADGVSARSCRRMGLEPGVLEQFAPRR